MQRIGLSAGAVEGEHQQFTQPFAQRMVVDQADQFGDHLVASAQFEVEGDPFLERGQPKLIQPGAFLLDELAVHPGQRIAPPQRQRGVQ